MKKGILLLFTFLMFTVSAIAQNCGYVEYYALFDSAAKNYAEKNYEAAEKNLKLAFEKIEFPLGEGLHLALKLAQKQKDAKWAEQIAITLAKGGVPLRFFRHLKKQEWYEKFDSNFETYSQYYKDNFHPELRDKLSSIIARDREFNAKYHDWRTRKIEVTLADLIAGASEIIADFKTLTDNYGFPNERMTGYNYVQRTDRIEYFKTDVLIIHIYQRGVLIFEDEIKDIICAGGLHPNYQETLKKIRGLGNSTGVEQEMKVRYQKFRGTK